MTEKAKKANVVQKNRDEVKSEVEQLRGDPDVRARIREAKETKNVAHFIPEGITTDVEFRHDVPAKIEGKPGSLLFVGAPFVRWTEDISGEIEVGADKFKLTLVGFDPDTSCGVYEWEAK